ncbi:2-hydroxyacyl-CoA dehydratase [Chloroflexota bacterium]
MYTEFLELCGFQPEEIKSESPRIHRAFERFGIGADDIEQGIFRIKEYYAVELQGIRRLLGVWVRELVDTALAGEEKRKIIYGEWPGAHLVLMMGAIHEIKDVHFAAPVSHTFMIVLGGIFDKLAPILEAGEDSGLPAGSAHCGLWQMHVGAIAKELIPKPDLILTSAYICDQAAEADQLLENWYGLPVAYLDGCLDWQWGDGTGTRQVEYVSKKLDKMRTKIEEVTGRDLSEEAAKAGIKDMATNFNYFKQLTQLMTQADPQPISQANLDLVYLALFTPIQHRAELNEATRLLVKELSQVIKDGKGVVPKGAPRIYITFRHANQPQVYKTIQDMGLATPICMLDWLPPRPEGEAQFSEPIHRIVQAIYRSAPVCSSFSNVRYNVEVCKAHKVNGIIIFFPFSCRPFAINPLMIRQAIQNELGIPAIVMEYGGYDYRDYPAEQMKTRIETFAELVKVYGITSRNG